MRATRILGLQPSRALQLRTTQALRMQASPAFLLQRTRMMRMPVPKEEHSAHTISQRLRTLKKMPMELMPLAFVLAAAIFAAIFAMVRKLMTDKQLRLTRQGPASKSKPTRH